MTDPVVARGTQCLNELPAHDPDPLRRMVGNELRKAVNTATEAEETLAQLQSKVDQARARLEETKAEITTLCDQLPVLEDVEERRREREENGEDARVARKRAAYYADRLAVAQGQKRVRLSCKGCNFEGLARARPQGDGEVAAQCPVCELRYDLGSIGEVTLVDA